MTNFSLLRAKLITIVSSMGVGIAAAFILGLPAKAANLTPFQPTLATVDDPNNHVTAEFDGVARLFRDFGLGEPFVTCGASVLTTGQHLLTAAHCLIEVKLEELFLDFGNDLILSPSKSFIHPEYNLNGVFDNDIAIIKLESKLPEDITRYDIYRDDDELGKVGVRVGYGAKGTGDQGVLPVFENFDNRRRAGNNIYDAYGEILSSLTFGGSNFFIPPGIQLVYDFDNGNPANDAFGSLFGIEDTGLGLDEVFPALGDSGGPTFIDGLIAGVTSYLIGANFTEELIEIDVTPHTDSSFGEIGGDTRVSYYANWIDGILSDEHSASTPESGIKAASTPEPAIKAALIIVGAALLVNGNKQRRNQR